MVIFHDRFFHGVLFLIHNPGGFRSCPFSPQGFAWKNINFSHGFLAMNPIVFWEILLMAEILHLLIGSLSHYLQGFIHPRWCRISSINSAIPLSQDGFERILILKKLIQFSWLAVALGWAGNSFQKDKKMGVPRIRFFVFLTCWGLWRVFFDEHVLMGNHVPNLFFSITFHLEPIKNTWFCYIQ